MSWRVLADNFVVLRDVVSTFVAECPEGYHVTATGAQVAHRDAAPGFLVQTGSVLCVSFAEDLLDDDDVHSAGDGPAVSGRPEPGMDDDAEGHARGGHAPPSGSPTANRDRSRTPRAGQAENEHPGDAIAVMTDARFAPSAASVDERLHQPVLYSDSRVAMCGRTSYQHVLAENKPCFTPVLLSCLGPVGALRALAIFSCVPSYCIALLLSSCAMHFDGSPWLPLGSEVADSAPCQEAAEEGAEMLVDADFCLLMPEYSTEWLRLTIVVPQAVPDLLGLVDTCRSASLASAFPRLVAVAHQRHRGFCCVLACPAWLRNLVVVCVDVSAPDVRLFAAVTPPVVDTFGILSLAGLASNASVDIFVNSSPSPLVPGEEISLGTGDCIHVCPLGSVCPHTTSPAYMLSRPDAWHRHAPGPERTDIIYYCLVTDASYRVFPLFPERSIHCRADIAAICGIRMLDLRIDPARPKISDVTLQGHSCRTVFAVGEAIRGSEEVLRVGFLDCRRLLQGWFRLSTSRSWLPLDDIRHRLQDSVPPGWVVFFSAVPDHWDWICFEPGQVLTVELRRGPTGLAPPIAFSDDATDYGADRSSASGDSSSPAGADPGPVMLGAVGEDISPRAGSQDGGGARHVFTTKLLPGLPALPWVYLALLALCVVVCVAVRCVLAGIEGHMELVGVLVGALFGRRYDGHRLWACVVVLLLVLRPVHSVQIRQPSCSARACLSVGDGRDTACVFPGEVGAHAFLRVPRPLFRTSSSVRGDGTLRDPCANHAVASWLQDIPGPTLLEEAVAFDRGFAFYQCATLLDTLVECAVVPWRPVPAATHRAPAVLSLAQLVPASPFQELVASLESLLPIPFRPDTSFLSAGHDWLDADLRGLTGDPAVPAHIAAVFGSIEYWHDASATGTLVSLDIFTDGSASTGGDVTLSAPCAWAFSVWAVTSAGRYLVGCAAHAAVPIDTPYWVGESHDDALESETLAIVWALVWVLEFGWRFRVPMTMRYDAIAVGAGVFGEQQPPRRQGAVGPTSIVELAVSLRQRATVWFGLQHAHVLGHSGVLGNELCDQLSKRARRHVESPYDRLLPEWPSKLLAHPLRDWAWMAHLSSPQLPSLAALETEAHRLQQVIPEPAAPSFGVQQVHEPEVDQVFDFTVASYNVLTLFDPGTVKGRKTRAGAFGMQIAGKRALLKKQMLACGIWALGLQETRLPTDAVLPDSDLLMLNAAADGSGSYGCSLWLNLSQSFARVGGRQRFVSRDQVVVTGFSPRHLQVQICTPWCQLTILVAHGPHAGCSDCSHVEAFWRDRAQALHRRPEGSELLLLVDANGRVGTVATSAVGPHAAEAENPVGAIFHEFLLQVECCLPSTYPDFHLGSSWTWATSDTQPDTRRRIDFVGAPTSWKQFALSSWVWEQIETMQLRVDHRPVCLQARFGRRAPAATYYHAHRRPCRPVSRPDATQARQFISTLASQASIPWTAGPDAHFAALVPCFKTAGQPLEPCFEAPPIQAHLSADTLVLVRQRAQIRAYLRCENQELRRRLLLISFAAFAAGTGGARLAAHAAAVAHQWLRQMDLNIAVAVRQLNHLVVDLRRALKLDRITYLHSLVQDIQLQDLRDPKRLFAAVRRAFPQARSARRSGFIPLPAVLCGDGSFAQTPADKLERWRGHFSDQEAGQVVTAEEYCDVFRRPDIPVLPHGPTFGRACLPTLGDIERQITALRPGKAAGPDGLTAEIYRVSPPTAALCMMPLFLKSCLQVQEPIEWRGGCLVALAKKAAAAMHCDNFRSILMASTMGKVYHRVVRTKLMPGLDGFKSPLQAGTSRGVGVDTVALMVRSFMGLFVCRSVTAAVTFYDIKAAYYRLIRHTLVPSLEDDRPLLALITRLGLPPESVSELRSQLARMALLSEAKVNDHTIAVVADMFRGTWFRLDKSAVLTATTRGSRPGDPLADVLFSFSMAGYLKAVDQALAERGMGTSIPEVPRRADWYECPDSANISHVSWADDYAHLQEAVDEPSLHEVVRASAKLHVEIASSVGMELTFAPDKSAVLLPASCLRVPLPVTSLNPQGLPGYYFQDAVTGRQGFLPVVDVYKHLGGIVTANCAPDTEISYRHSQALAMLRPLRHKLFASASVPLTIRTHLLRSLVVSRFVFASAITDLTRAVHRRTWCKHYVGLWRALRRRRAQDEHVHSYEVLLHAGATSPLLSLAMARSVFLRRLFDVGPVQLLHMLHAHWCIRPANSWLSMLEQDIRAVAPYCTAAEALLAMPCPITALLEAVRSDAAWWPAQVRAAVKGFAKDLRAWKPAPVVATPVAAAVELPFRCCLVQTAQACSGARGKSAWVAVSFPALCAVALLFGVS